MSSTQIAWLKKCLVYKALSTSALLTVSTRKKSYLLFLFSYALLIQGPQVNFLLPGSALAMLGSSSIRLFNCRTGAEGRCLSLRWLR